MSVHKKLMQARVMLQGTKLEMSGLNKFAGYRYFTLADFLPSIQTIFNEVGLCGFISYNTAEASLTIIDVEGNTSIVITSPMAEAQLKGTHPIQNLGAVETYQRRYLWMTAMEIVEHDILDATMNPDEPPAQPKKPANKPVEKTVKASPPESIEGKSTSWILKVTSVPDGDVEEWASLISDATNIQLQQVTAEKDVMQLFQTNRNIYDKVKELMPSAYEALMETFKATRAKYKKEAA